MGDNVIHDYIKDLIDTDIEEDKFDKYIDIFSKFMGYTNSDYKYNSTFLNQYISDFKEMHSKLRDKQTIYLSIFTMLLRMNVDFELSIDNTFYATRSEIEYLGIDKEKIIKNLIEVKVSFREKFTFCKEYDYLNDKLLDRVCKDLISFLKRKKIGEISNDEIA